MIIYGHLHSAADPGGGLIGTGPKTIKIGIFLPPAHPTRSSLFRRWWGLFGGLSASAGRWLCDKGWGTRNAFFRPPAKNSNIRVRTIILVFVHIICRSRCLWNEGFYIICNSSYYALQNNENMLFLKL